VFSDEGQNIWLKGFARPVRAEAMEAAGTIDEAAFGALPEAQGEAVNLTPEQEEAAKAVLGAGWAQAIS
jgi:putative spermidine/putrescine transport system substrate-binding protein